VGKELACLIVELMVSAITVSVSVKKVTQELAAKKKCAAEIAVIKGYVLMMELVYAFKDTSERTASSKCVKTTAQASSLKK
jgi:hypothetical protein